MKSKLVILSLMLASAATAVNGQTKEKYVNEKASDNIFVSVTGGISMVNSGKSEGKFGSPAPHITLSLGKWFTPVWGVRAQLSQECRPNPFGRYVQLVERHLGIQS